MRKNITERYFRVMTYQPVDRVPDIEFGYWPQTLRRWLKEGMPVGLTDDDRGRNGTDISTFIMSILRQMGSHIDGTQRRRHGRQRLHRHADHNGFTIAHAALNTTGGISLSIVSRLLFIKKLIMHLTAEPFGNCLPQSYFHRFHGIDAHHGRCDMGI